MLKWFWGLLGCEEGMEFVEGKLVEEKVFGDVVFPKTLLPWQGEARTCDLIEMVKSKHVWLTEQLQQHGAILFRGFDVSSAEDFARVVECFGWEEMGYVGATTRIKVTDRVLTANEAPLNQLINFHHEMSLVKEFPSKIFFFCVEPSPEGGETSIVPSHIVVEKMEKDAPDFVAKLAEMGFIFRIKTAKDDDSVGVITKTWKWHLNTDDKVEAEKRAKLKLSCSSVNFYDDGSGEFVYGPINPIRKFGDKHVWFQTILGYTNNAKDVDVSFGDGTHFPASAMDAYQRILNENCVDLIWKKGDVLLVDNLSVQHARRPGKPPRVILVSICK